MLDTAEDLGATFVGFLKGKLAITVQELSGLEAEAVLGQSLLGTWIFVITFGVDAEIVSW